MNPLSIVLPCYNPPQDWTKHVVEAYHAIAKIIGFNPQLIIVNDGSTKPVDAAIAALSAEIDNMLFIDAPQNRGKGAALRTGIAQAHSELIIYTDIDFPYSLESFIAIYQTLKHNNVDIAVGIKDKSYYHFLPAYRKFISKALRKGIQLCFRLPVNDTQCGLKGFNAKGKSVFLQTSIDRYLFDLEFIYLASRKSNDLIVKPVEIKLRPDVIFRAMNMKILLEESRNFFKILFRTQSR